MSVAGAVACAFAIGRTRWALVLMGGFAGEVVTGILCRVMPTVLSYTGGGIWQIAYLFGSLAHR